MTSYYDNFLVCISEALKGIEITTRNGERLEPEEGFSRLCRFSEEIRNAGHTQFLCGNGASSSFTNHMALDWTKNGHVRTLEQLNRTDEQLSRTIRKLDDIGRQLGED